MELLKAGAMGSDVRMRLSVAMTIFMKWEASCFNKHNLWFELCSRSEEQ